MIILSLTVVLRWVSERHDGTHSYQYLIRWLCVLTAVWRCVSERHEQREGVFKCKTVSFLQTTFLQKWADGAPSGCTRDMT